MNTKNNIDELLKQEFDNFTPDAPDVWSGIEQAVQTSSLTTTATSVKTGILSGKIIATVAGIAITTGALIAYNYFAPSTATQQVVADKPLLSAETVAEPEQMSVTSVIPNKTVEPTEQAVEDKEQNPAIVSKEKKKGMENKENKVKEAPQTKQKESKDKVSNETNIQPTVEAQDKAVKVENPVVGNQIAQPAKNEVHVSIPDNSRTEQAKTEQNKAEHKGSLGPLDATDGEFYKPVIPGSFSPDGMDQVNENFVIEIQNEASFKLMILDRNGKVVFESDSKEKTWNGRNMKNGEECPKGWYFFTLRYRLNGQEESEQVSGKICLFR